METPPVDVSAEAEATTTQAAGKTTCWRVLYLFAGPERHADIRFHLKQLADSQGIKLCMEEFDILRDKAQDLTLEDVWSKLWKRVNAGEFDFIILAPPCNTFSRARHNVNCPGPKPLRLIEYPRGFPWLKESDLNKVKVANLLVDRSFEICKVCVNLNIGFLLEHPEQLGLAHGTVPASIWNFEQFQELVATGSVAQAAIFQCIFGAPTSKPTRLASSAYAAFEASPFSSFAGPHVLDEDGSYLGPLPRQCPHKTHDLKLIGKDQQGNWNTGPSAAYPPEMCKQIALLIQQHLCGCGKQRGAVFHNKDGGAVFHNKDGGAVVFHNTTEQLVSGLLADSDKQDETAASVNEVAEEEEWDEKDELFHGNLQQAARDNAGLPMTCRWQGRAKSFADGGGLNSPGRWAPEDRGVRLTGERSSLVDKLALLVRTFVVRWITDLQRSTFQLATGNMKQCPFPEQALDKLREEWFVLLGDSDRFRQVPEFQPFYLFALEETLKQMGDEDWEVIASRGGDNYVTGRVVGVSKPIEPAPLIFRQNRRRRKYDASEFNPLAENYPSAEEAKHFIEKQFQEEEKLGWMYPLSDAEAKRRFGDKLRIASLAAIPKDETRVLFDGTHSVQVNNEIKISDRLEFPSPSELAHIMEHSQVRNYGVVLSIAADIMKAHRRFLHAVEDHGYLGCKADSSSSTVWINRVGTFGVACAALHFGRLAAAIFRLVMRIMKTQPCFQLLFADDLKLVVGGSSKYMDLWSMLVIWLMVGTPFSWKKFRGGTALDYVGFWTDYARFRLGLSEKRAAWVVSTIEDMIAAKFVTTGRRFSELLGRLGFAAQAVPWLRPLLGAFYAWDGILSPFMAARAPALVAMTLRMVLERFKKGDFTSPCWSPQRTTSEAFRTDAKCEHGRIVLGGWELVYTSSTKQARWFALEVTPEMAPWLFYKGLDVQRMSTTAELLATYAALHAFGFILGDRDLVREKSLAMVAGGTDNLANEQLSRKRLTTKLPLGALLLQFHTKLWDNGLWMDLRWRPRGENVEADQLTNLVFTDFNLANRVDLQYAQMDLRLLESLQDHLKSFEESTTRTDDSRPFRKGLSKRLKMETKSKW